MRRADLPRLAVPRPTWAKRDREVEPRRWWDLADVDAADGPVQVLVYGPIDSWGGEYGLSAAELVRALAPYTDRDLVVRVNSPGGDVFDGMAIYNALLSHQGRVDVVVEGLAASAASIVAMAGDSVAAMRTSQVMIHDAWTIAIGDAAEMHAAGDMLDAISQQIADVYARKAGGDPDEWRARMKAETWLSAAEASALGLVDEVRDPERGKPATQTTEARASEPAGSVIADAALASALMKERTRSWTDSRK